MQIIVKSNLAQNETQLETQSTTLGALLGELQNNKKIELFDTERGEVYPDCDVLVNGQPYQLLADGLDTSLKDGDKVEIIMCMFMLGGG